jgi:hypothetical protein
VERLQARVDSSERERNRGSPNLDRDEEKSAERSEPHGPGSRTGGSAACSAESAAMHEFIRELFRFTIKIVPEHVSRVGVEREESKPFVFLLEVSVHDGY